MTDKNVEISTNSHHKTSVTTTDFVFKTTDILGNTVVLKQNTLNNHIAGEGGDHPERHYLNYQSNITKVQKIIERPNQILKDKSFDNRYNYMATIAFDSQTSVKGVKIVTEEISPNYHEVVTFYSNKTLREKVEGRVLYDCYTN